MVYCVLCIMVYGDGVWCIVYSVWCMVCGVRCIMYGVWCIMYGVWCMLYGVWCMVYNVWCMVYGVWCMVYGVWCIKGRPISSHPVNPSMASNCKWLFTSRNLNYHILGVHTNYAHTSAAHTLTYIGIHHTNSKTGCTSE